jgi:hypothetical protein
MGLNIKEYRARMGSFSGIKWTKKAKSGGWREECNIKLWFSGLVVAMLLVVGGTEMNPSPLSVKEGAEIF